MYLIFCIESRGCISSGQGRRLGHPDLQLWWGLPWTQHLQNALLAATVDHLFLHANTLVLQPPPSCLLSVCRRHPHTSQTGTCHLFFVGTCDVYTFWPRTLSSWLCCMSCQELFATAVYCGLLQCSCIKEKFGTHCCISLHPLWMTLDKYQTTHQSFRSGTPSAELRLMNIQQPMKMSCGYISSFALNSSHQLCRLKTLGFLHLVKHSSPGVLPRRTFLLLFH